MCVFARVGLVPIRLKVQGSVCFEKQADPKEEKKQAEVTPPFLKGLIESQLEKLTLFSLFAWKAMSPKLRVFMCVHCLD